MHFCTNIWGWPPLSLFCPSWWAFLNLSHFPAFLLLLVSVSSHIYKLLSPSPSMPFKALPARLTTLWQRRSWATLSCGSSLLLAALIPQRGTHDHVRQKDPVTLATDGNFVLCLPPSKPFTSRIEGTVILAPVSFILAPRAPQSLWTCSSCPLAVSF